MTTNSLGKKWIVSVDSRRRNRVVSLRWMDNWISFACEKRQQITSKKGITSHRHENNINQSYLLCEYKQSFVAHD